MLNGTTEENPNFFAPTAAGDAGQILQSNGNGAPDWILPPMKKIHSGTSFSIGNRGELLNPSRKLFIVTNINTSGAPRAITISTETGNLTAPSARVIYIAGFLFMTTYRYASSGRVCRAISSLCSTATEGSAASYVEDVTTGFVEGSDPKQWYDLTTISSMSPFTVYEIQ